MAANLDEWVSGHHQPTKTELSIDANLLITDACPADVLLQRLGRLHRHRQGGRPTAIMIDPGDLENYLTQEGRPIGRKGQGWAWVYRNLLSVAETLHWIRKRGAITVPDDCRQPVERASHVDYLREQAEGLGGAWLALWRRLYIGDLIKQQLDEAGLVDWSKPYDDENAQAWQRTLSPSCYAFVFPLWAIWIARSLFFDHVVGLNVGLNITY